MIILASRTYIQEREYHQSSLARSTQSTAREIELYVGGLRRAMDIFAAEEHAVLTQAVTQAHIEPALREKLMLHFPEQLAFALSEPHEPIALINEPDLFGDHCRANMSLYSQDKQELDSGLSLHSSGTNATQHFDVVTTFPMGNHKNDELGVIFVSFGIDDLTRLLQAGSSTAYILSLRNRDQSVLSQSSEFLLTAEAIGYEDGLLAKPDYVMSVVGTQWILQGSMITAETSRAWHASFIQTLIGTVVLIIAGLTAWRSIEQEKVSRSRTAIVLNSVESERKRIARELHDQALSDITHAQRLLMDLEPASVKHNSESASKLLTAQQSVAEFSDIIRVAIDDLYPHTLENLGLVKALESYIVKRCEGGPSLTLDIDQRVDTSFGSTQKLHLYRIISELVNNALNHAECTKLVVNINQKSDSVVVRVMDNGKGFDHARGRTPNNHGIDNLESRAMMLNAVYRWIDNGKTGTCFELMIPVE